MNILQLTPGSGPLDCGNGPRDNASVAELRRQAHDVTLMPLYLPLVLDESDQGNSTPVFYSTINIGLDQKYAFWRRAPGFLRRLLSSRIILGWTRGRLAKISPAGAGDLMLSLLRGEEGNQARELDDLISWLRRQPKPDVICLSNSLLAGMARRLKAELQTPVVCALHGEDLVLDALPETHRAAVWALLANRAADVDLFIAPGRYYANLMTRRLGLKPERVRVIHDGVDLDGYRQPAPEPARDGIRQPATRLTQNAAPVLGFLARQCVRQGLDTLVEAFIQLKNRDRIPRLKLHLGGPCGPGDEAFVKTIRQRLAQAGFIGETSFAPNPSRAEKISFLEALSVFSVPARESEASGISVLEAMAAGVPVVQPRTAVFPELIETTGGGVLYEPGDAKMLAEAIEALLLEPERARALGEAGRRAVFAHFSVEAMADKIVKALAELVWLKTP